VVFSSYLFLFYFLPLTLGTYYVLPARWRMGVLTVFSYVFYGWTNPLYVPLMWFSTFVDYVAGAIIATEGHSRGPEYLRRDGPRSRRQRLALIVSVSSNLALLGFFKYFQFGIESYQVLMQNLGYAEMVPDAIWQIVLPLGISFYTFQSLSYTIDVYRGEARPAHSFLDFACYVSLFPQLVAGPIIRFQDLADQLEERSHTWAKFARGVLLFQLGLAKKVILANSCGFLAEASFNAGTLECGQAWWGLLAYTLQIYFDFSGYSDMAVGLGLMFGFTFPQNFDSPYRSASLSEFWRRWHISLSTWLREYLYIPLGGNRLGPVRTYVNLFVVMLLGGLWHGAAWNFLIWGGYHGILLAIERFWNENCSQYWSQKGARLKPIHPAWWLTRVGVTSLLVALGWVLFRAHSLTHAGHYFAALGGLAEVQPATSLLWKVLFPPYHVICMCFGLLIVWFAPTAWRFTDHITLTKAIWGVTLFLFSIVLLALQQYNPFIYFLF
jgi:alginate O-acetyltransferase complex protein AlgI